MHQNFLHTAFARKGIHKNGILFLLLAVSAILFISARPTELLTDSSQCMNPVNLSTAKTMYGYYSATLNPTSRAHFSAFSVNSCQVEAMKLIFRNNPGAVACRVYPGYETERADKLYMLVIGVDHAGRDLDTFAYKTTSDYAGFCPPLCDASSPLASGVSSDTVRYNIGEPLSVASASKLIANYRNIDLQTTGGIRYFKVSRDQFQIMERLTAASSQVKGFRLYYGTAGVAKATILLIASVGSSGTDLDLPVYPVSLTNAGLCPHYCDNPTAIESGK
jgi:hypothetical protein